MKPLQFAMRHLEESMWGAPVTVYSSAKVAVRELHAQGSNVTLIK